MCEERQSAIKWWQYSQIQIGITVVDDFSSVLLRLLFFSWLSLKILFQFLLYTILVWFVFFKFLPESFLFLKFLPGLCDIGVVALYVDRIIFFCFCSILGVPPPPLFSRFSDLKDGKTDRIKIFITNRPPKMMRPVFEEKKSVR